MTPAISAAPPSASQHRQALGLFAVLGLILHGWRFLAGASGHVRVHDTFDSEWPRFVNEARALFEFGPQSWLTQISGGMPANAFHFTQFHPMVIGHHWLPTWAMFDSLLVIMWLGGGYGAYRLLAAGFGIRHHAALTIGMIYAAFGQVVLPVAAFEMTFPLVLSLLHWPSARLPVRLAGAGAAGVLTLMIYPILHGPALAMGHAVVLAMLWLHGRPMRGELATAALFWTAIVVGFLPNVPALLEYLPYNSRDYVPVEAVASASLGLGFIKSVFKHLFSTAALFGLGGALVAALAAARWDRTLAVASGALALGLLVTAAFSHPFNTVFHGTFLQKMDLQHLSRGLPLLVILVLGLALDRAALAGTRTWRFAAGAVIGIALSMALSQLPLRFAIWLGFATLLIGLEAHAWTRRPGRSLSFRTTPVIAAMLACGMIELSLALPMRHDKFLPPSPVLDRLAEEARTDPFRVIVSGLHPAPVQMAGIETVDSRSPMFSRNFRIVVSLLPAATPRPANEALYWSYWYDLVVSVLTNGTITTADTLKLPAAAAQNVRYILSPRPIAGLETVMRDDTVTVSKIPQAHGRGHLFGHAVITETDADAKRMLAELPAERWRTDVVLSRESGAPARIPSGIEACGSVRITHYQPDRLDFAIETMRECILVVTNNYHHHWQATIDGGDAAIFPANLAFQGILVPQGRHEVTFAFRPPGFPAMLALVPLGAVMAFLAFFQPWRRRPVYFRQNHNSRKNWK